MPDSMIFFFYGKNSFLSKEKLKEIIEHFQKIYSHQLELKIFDANEISFQEFQNSFFNLPIFKKKILLVLKNVFINPQFKNLFLKELEKIFKNKNILILFEEKEISSKDLLFLALQGKAKFYECNSFEEKKKRKIIKKRLEKFHLKISPQALSLLLNSVGNDFWQLENEIQKLITFKLKGEIELEDVKKLVKSNSPINIFSTLDAIVERRRSLALNLLQKNIKEGNHPVFLFKLFINYFRNLLLMRELMEKKLPFYLISKKLNLSSFLLQKIYSQSKKFSLNELKRIYKKLFKLDLEIKIGKIDPLFALESLIFEI